MLNEIHVVLIRLYSKKHQCFPVMHRLVFTICLFGIAGLSLAQSDSPSASGKSDEFAQLPYHELVKIAHSDSSQKKEEDQLTFTLASTKGVPFDQIKLTLQLKKGPISLPIDGKGHFKLPFSDQLIDENPLMISNQPRGSLSLKFTLAIPEMGKMEPPNIVEGKVKYQAVFQSLVKFKEAMKKVDTKFGEDGSQQLAVQCITSGKSVTIHQKFGSRTLKADKDGEVWLLYNERLFQENPDISVPDGTEFNLRPLTVEKAKEIK